MDEQRRYRPRGHATWRAQVTTAPLPSQQAPRPGPVTDADDERLAELRRRVVEPVVRATMTVDEVETLSLHWGVDGRAGDVWVRIEAPDSRYEDWLPSPWWRADPHDVPVPTADVEIAEHLADRLQDWIAESSFAWGQLRRSSFPPSGG